MMQIGADCCTRPLPAVALEWLSLRRRPALVVKSTATGQRQSSGKEAWRVRLRVFETGRKTDRPTRPRRLGRRCCCCCCNKTPIDAGRRLWSAARLRADKRARAQRCNLDADSTRLADRSVRPSDLTAAIERASVAPPPPPPPPRAGTTCFGRCASPHRCGHFIFEPLERV